MALGTNKMSSHDGNGNRDQAVCQNGYIQFKKVVWFIVAALIGSSIGSNLTLLVSDKIFTVYDDRDSSDCCILCYAE